jgi:hypothetical protein
MRGDFTPGSICKIIALVWLLFVGVLGIAAGIVALHTKIRM